MRGIRYGVDYINDDYIDEDDDDSDYDDSDDDDDDGLISLGRSWNAPARSVSYASNTRNRK